MNFLHSLSRLRNCVRFKFTEKTFHHLKKTLSPDWFVFPSSEMCKRLFYTKRLSIMGPIRLCRCSFHDASIYSILTDWLSVSNMRRHIETVYVDYVCWLCERTVHTLEMVRRERLIESGKVLRCRFSSKWHQSDLVWTKFASNATQFRVQFLLMSHIMIFLSSIRHFAGHFKM